MLNWNSCLSQKYSNKKRKCGIVCNMQIIQSETIKSIAENLFRKYFTVKNQILKRIKKALSFIKGKLTCKFYRIILTPKN